MEQLPIYKDYYQVMVEESFDGIFIQKGTKIWLANKRLHEMLGYEPYELVGQDHWIIYTEEYQALTRERALRRMRGEDVPSRYHVRLLRKDGSWIYGEINAKAVEVEGEKGVLVWIKDMHQQILMQRALEESERKFKSAFEHAAIGIAMVDLSGFIIDCNEYFCSFIGYSKQEVVRLNVKDITHKEDWLTEVEMQRTLTSCVCDDVVFEKRFITKDGNEVWGRVSGALVKDMKNLPLYFIFHIQDITREKIALKSLKEKEAFISVILNTIPECVIVFDYNMKPIYVNPAFESLFGWTKEEFFENPYIYLPKDREYRNDVEVIHSIIDSGESYVETQRMTKGGRILDVLINAASIKEGPLKGYVLIVRDVTSLNQVRQRAESMQRMESLGYLAGGIAHDFNNLLTGVLGRATMLSQSGKLPQECRQYLQDIERCAMEAANLTKQLLSYARGEELKLVRLNINEVIEDTLKLFGRTRKDVTIFKLLEPTVQPLMADRTQIKQVIMNLLVNAADAVEGGGQIFVETSMVVLDRAYMEPYGLNPGHYVRIAITDNGIGMSEEVKKRIFEPFFSTKELGRGTGMGLATVYSIVKSHKGIINCYSELGQGTTFSIYLPVEEGVSVEDTKREEEEEVLKGEGIILIVDDEDYVLEVAKDILEFLGYSVVTASSGKQAISIYSESPNAYDLVILDIVMPEMSGKEVFKKIREINPNQKVLFASGYSLNGVMINFKTESKVGFLQKPFNMNEMSKKVREMISEND